MEELHESDVVWPDDTKTSWSPTGSADSGINTAPESPSRSSRAAPREIPKVRRRASGSEEEDVTTEWAPPHVLASTRRVKESKMAFSLCSGQGRTLKGRDLSHVRDSVMRITGFLEG